MAASVSGTTESSFSVTQKIDVGLGTNAQFPVNKSDSVSWANGTGAGQADETYAEDSSVAVGVPVNLDLTSLSQTNGTVTKTANFDSVVAIKIVNTSTDSTLTIGGAASNAWATLENEIPVRPGAVLHIQCGSSDATGMDVDATHKVIKLAHGGGGSSAITAQVYIVGRSA